MNRAISPMKRASISLALTFLLPSLALAEEVSVGVPIAKGTPGDHSGYVNGYRCEIALSRTENLGICVLFNANSDLARQCVPAFFEQWNQFKSGGTR
jgi:hypothetical protein